MTTTAAEPTPLPYPVPPRWGGKRSAIVAWVFSGFFAAISLIMLTGFDPDPGEGGAPVYTFAWAALMVWSWGTGRRAVRRLPQLVDGGYAARFRRLPMRLAVGFLLFGLLWAVFASLGFGIAIELGDVIGPFILMIVEVIVSTAVAAFFLGIAITSIVTHSLRTRWGRNGVRLTATGISLAVRGLAADIAWDDLTRIEATQKPSAKKSVWSMGDLELAWTGGATVIRSSLLGVSPIVLYQALHFYRQFPDARAELAISVAHDRMGAWLQAFLSAR